MKNVLCMTTKQIDPFTYFSTIILITCGWMLLRMLSLSYTSNYVHSVNAVHCCSLL